MDKGPKSDLGKEAASTADLFAHPVAGAAAMSALGFGLAGHAFGIWMGALTGAVGVSQRLFDPISDKNTDAERVEEKRTVATKRNAGTKARASAKPGVSRKRASERVAADLVSGDSGGRVATAVPVSATVDDLKSIPGVGPKLEQVLNGIGVVSYGQIAAWDAEDIAAVEKALGFEGRIGRDDWVGRAKALAEAAAR